MLSTVNDIRTLVLVGKTGNGKSATGNSILGKGTFNLSRGKKSVAENAVARTNDLVKGQTIEVIDTPGVLDISSEYKTIGNEILNSINLATNGIHALLIVLSVRSRFSDAEEGAVYYLLDLFGINILKYAILVFTGGDDLDEEDKEDDLVRNVEGDRLTDYLRGNCPDSLKEIRRLCSNRMVLFDNKTKDKTKNSNQVHKLLSLIDQVQAQNGGKPYTEKNCEEVDLSDLIHSHLVPDIKKIVLMGKTGSEKTATGYSIMGKQELRPSLSKKSDGKNGVTSGCYSVQGETIEIIDIPGRIFEMSKSVANEFLNSIDSENTGIHALLLVLSLETKFYEPEKALVDALQVLFGKQICNYMIVVLTGGDSLNKEADNEIVEDEVLDNHLRLNHSKSLEDILTLCGNRKVLFDNKTADESKKSNQVMKLLSLVSKLLAENGGEPYRYKKREENARVKEQGQEDGLLGESSLPEPKIQKQQEEQPAQLTPKTESKLHERESKPQGDISAHVGDISAQQELTAAKQSKHEEIKNYIEIPKDSTQEMPSMGSKTIELVRESGNAKIETNNNAVGKEAFIPSLIMTSNAKTVVAETNDHTQIPPVNIIDTPDQVPKLLPLINKVLAENGGDPATQELAQKDVIPKLQGYAVGFLGESSQTNGKIEKLYRDPKESELPETGELQYERIPKIGKELDKIRMAKEKDKRNMLEIKNKYKKDMENRTAREKELRGELKREMRGMSKMGKQPKCGSCSIL